MLLLENSHNMAGGRITPPDRMQELIAVARSHGLAVHLDGARVHSSAATLGITAADLTRGCDTVMFCLSKGLGAPVGSVVVGNSETITEARRIRKMLGGGMRQAGVIAAAGLVALEEILPRIGEDNATARRLADLLGEIPGIDLDPATVETNIVFFGISETAGTSAAELSRRLANEGVFGARARCKPRAHGHSLPHRHGRRGGRRRGGSVHHHPTLKAGRSESFQHPYEQGAEGHSNRDQRQAAATQASSTTGGYTGKQGAAGGTAHHGQGRDGHPGSDTAPLLHLLLLEPVAQHPLVHRDPFAVLHLFTGADHLELIG